MAGSRKRRGSASNKRAPPPKRTAAAAAATQPEQQDEHAAFNLLSLPDLILDYICAFLRVEGPCKDLVNFRLTSARLMGVVDDFIERTPNIPPVKLSLKEMESRRSSFVLEMRFAAINNVLFPLHELVNRIESRTIEGKEGEEETLVRIPVRNGKDKVLPVIGSLIGRRVDAVDVHSLRGIWDLHALDAILGPSTVDSMSISFGDLQGDKDAVALLDLFERRRVQRISIGWLFSFTKHMQYDDFISGIDRLITRSVAIGGSYGSYDFGFHAFFGKDGPFWADFLNKKVDEGRHVVKIGHEEIDFVLPSDLFHIDYYVVEWTLRT